MVFFLILTVSILLFLAAIALWRIKHVDNRFVPDGSFCSVDGARLHYHFFPAAVHSQKSANTPTLVFLHGASGNAYDSMLAFRQTFEGRYPLLFLDRPGLGFSERCDKRHGTLEGQARLIVSCLDELRIRDAIVVGHSLGGAVAAAVGLAAGDRVTGLAFLAPVTHPWPGGVTWYYTLASLPVVGTLFCNAMLWPVAEVLAPGAIAHSFHPDPVPENYAEKTRLSLLYRPKVFRANAFDVTRLKGSVIRQSQNYDSLRQPALVVSGTNDTVVWPSIHCEGLLTDLPDVELLMLDGAGHMPHHTHTLPIASALERLIDRIREKDQAAANRNGVEDLQMQK